MGMSVIIPGDKIPDRVLSDDKIPADEIPDTDEISGDKFPTDEIPKRRQNPRKNDRIPDYKILQDKLILRS